MSPKVGGDSTFFFHSGGQERPITRSQHLINAAVAKSEKFFTRDSHTWLVVWEHFALGPDDTCNGQDVRNPLQVM